MRTVMLIASLMLPAAGFAADEPVGQAGRLVDALQLQTPEGPLGFRVYSPGSSGSGNPGATAIRNNSGVAIEFIDRWGDVTPVAPREATRVLCSEDGDARPSKVRLAGDSTETPVSVRCGEWIEIRDPRAPRVRQPLVETLAGTLAPHATSKSETAGYTIQATGDLYFDGTVGYEIKSGNAKLTADKICNGRSSGTSGTIIVNLWFTTGSNPVGDGYEGAEATLDPLNGGWCWVDVVLNANFKKPPPGTYYVHLTLAEYPNEDTIVDYVTFSDQVTFSSNPNPPAPPVPGGALTPGALLSLLGWMALRRRRIAMAARGHLS